jgi:uncharacterized protein (TIGR02996 family)
MTRSHESAFLEAILADPDDDSPRLIYADWLDERGDADRAEFIRVQCALHAAPADDPRRPAWRDREAALLTAHEAGWLGPLRGQFYLWAFRRGFLEEVTLNAPAFLDGAAALFRAAPVRLARLLKATGAMDRLANCPQLRRVAALHLTGCGVGDAGAAALAGSPHVAGLVTLRLGDNAIGDHGAERLAASPHLARLRVLNLSHNDIGNAGARALAESPYLRGLQTLCLDGNRITPMGARPLAEALYLRGPTHPAEARAMSKT